MSILFLERFNIMKINQDSSFFGHFHWIGGLFLFLLSAMGICLFSTIIQAADTASEQTKGQTVRVGYYSDSKAFQWGSSDEEMKSGYAYDFYQEIAKYTGWNYEYVYGSFTDIVTMLQKGEVDIAAGISNMGEHSDTMLFPDSPMGQNTYYIYAPSSQAKTLDPDDMSALNGARIGAKRNTAMNKILKHYAKKHHFKYQIVLYDTLDKRLFAQETGEVDFILTVDNNGMEGFKPVYNLGSFGYYFAINKQRPDLLEELNQAQELLLSNSPYFITSLENKYFNQASSELDFSKEESDWLSSKKELCVGYLDDYMPFCDIDANGNLDGALKELLSVLSQHLHISFTSQGYDTYQSMINDLNQGKLDLIFPTFYNLWYSELENYDQVTPVAKTHICQVYAENYKQLKYDRITVSNGSPLHSLYLSTHFPDAQQIIHNQWSECLDAVISGEADCMLISSDLLYRFINQSPKYAALNVAEMEDFIELSFAVRHGNANLYSILNKTVKGLDAAIINDAIVRYSYVEPSFTIHNFVVEHLGLISMLVAAFVITLAAAFSLYFYSSRKARKLLETAYEQERLYTQAQQQSQAAIQEAYETAQRANQAKTDFLARMSHDMRTPLNAIIGMTTLADAHSDEPERVAQFHKNILASGNQLLVIINEILDLSKIDSNQTENTEEPIHLPDLLEKIAALIQSQPGAKKQTIITQTNTLIHENVIGNKAQMEHILHNLMENAVKFSSEDGTIWLRVSEKPIENPTLGCYEFSVEDQGIGISEEFIEHIFEPFTQENIKNDGPTHGLGLGLAMTHNIVQRMGGQISVKSIKGAGTIFTIILMLRFQTEIPDANTIQDDEQDDIQDDVQIESKEPLQALSSENFSKKRILLVEDNELNAEIAEELLKMAGLETEHAWNGQEALDILLKHEPGYYNLIFMDIMMPVMNGYECSKAIRASGREDLEHIAIIALSANTFPDDIQASLEAGMNEHLPKPLDIAKLTETLQKYL